MRSRKGPESATVMSFSPFGFSGVYEFRDGTVRLNHRFHSTFTMGFTRPEPSRSELGNCARACCGGSTTKEGSRAHGGKVSEGPDQEGASHSHRVQACRHSLFLGMAAWRAWEGDYLWSALTVVLAAILFAVYVAPRMLRLRRKKKE